MENQFKKDAFILKAQLKHENKYDYSKVVYKTIHTKVCIVCPEHGEFWQRPSSHLNGCGCPKCGRIRTIKSKTSNVSKFIKKSNKVHNNFYDYSKSEYINNSTNICIICPTHGEFWQTPRNHLQGKGCPLCARDKISIARKSNTDIFIDKSKQIHNNYYIYDNVSYIDCTQKVCIICPIHGEFWQSPSSHLSGCGCQICGLEKSKLKQTQIKETFIQNARQIHYTKYDYSKVEYINSKTKVCIICPKHGDFWQTPDHHLQGEGCPKCHLIASKAENEIIDTLKPLKCEQGNRKILNGKEIDIYIPSLKLGIEYNGLLWHSETYGKDKRYHINKLEDCEKQGIRLIQIFEDEWVNHRRICEYKLREICDLNNSYKIGENEYIIRSVTNKQTVYNFCEKYHIQGKTSFSVCIGAFYNNELIAVMTFKRLIQNNYIINRMAANFNYQIINFKENAIYYFINKHTFGNLSIKLNRRWASDYKSYEKIGFSLDSIIPPKCFYYNKNEKYKRHKMPFSIKNNYSKIWDCGYLKLTYNKK